MSDAKGNKCDEFPLSLTFNIAPLPAGQYVDAAHT